MTALRIEQATVQLGRFTLGPISVAAPMGQVTVILGPNGGGKSTLLRTACGLQRLVHGRVSLEGHVVCSRSAAWRASRIAFVAQRPAVPPALTVAEVVALGRLRTGERGAVDVVLREVGLLERRDEPMEHLSEGQRHRVAIARALVQLGSGTGVLAVDEPTSSLDPAWCAMLLARLRVTASTGAAVLVATHDLVFAAACADRVILLRQGGLEGEGSRDQMMDPDRLARVFGATFERVRRADGSEAILPRW